MGDSENKKELIKYHHFTLIKNNIDKYEFRTENARKLKLEILGETENYKELYLEFCNMFLNNPFEYSMGIETDKEIFTAYPDYYMMDNGHGLPVPVGYLKSTDKADSENIEKGLEQKAAEVIRKEEARNERASQQFKEFQTEFHNVYQNNRLMSNKPKWIKILIALAIVIWGLWIIRTYFSTGILVFYKQYLLRIKLCKAAFSSKRWIWWVSEHLCPLLVGIVIVLFLFLIFKEYKRKRAYNKIYRLSKLDAKEEIEASVNTRNNLFEETDSLVMEGKRLSFGSAGKGVFTKFERQIKQAKKKLLKPQLLRSFIKRRWIVLGIVILGIANLLQVLQEKGVI